MMENKTADIKYKLIPMDEITPEARRIAVAWVENYKPHGSIMPEIAQKQKLASDIMNYASQQCLDMQAEIERLKMLIASDSVYWALRNCIKSPSTLGDVEDDAYQDLYNLSCELRKALNSKQ